MLDSNFLTENNARHFWHPMGAPADSIDSPPPIIVGGQGVRIKDLEGNELVDAVGGLWNVNLGFSCEPVKKAISEQLERLPYYSTFRGSTTDRIIELSYALMEFFEPEGMGRAFFTSGGSDSVETALKLARQYHRLKGEPGRTKFISLRSGYHGTHFGGASVNGGTRFREQYEPLMAGCYHVPCPNVYRNPFDEPDPESLATRCAHALEAEIEFQGPGTIAAFIMEPILGAGGVIVPHESFMPAVREICSRHGILLISDEVITGFGRTGAWSGSRLWGVRPDMMTIAKAITTGYFPFGAALVSKDIADAFETDAGPNSFIGHGYTYSGHPVGAAAAIACLEETNRLNVVENAAKRGEQLYNGLLRLKEKYEVVGDVRGGRGLMLALELVSDRGSKAPISKEQLDDVHRRIYEQGVMVRLSGPNLLMSPPLILSEEDAEVILGAVGAGLSSWRPER